MNERINVRGSGNGVDVVGYITAEATMPVKFHSYPTVDMLVTGAAQDIVTGTGNGGIIYTEYAFYTYITEANAVSYGWPTGTNSFVFSHSGQITNFVDLP